MTNLRLLLYYGVLFVLTGTSCQEERPPVEVVHSKVPGKTPLLYDAELIQAYLDEGWNFTENNLEKVDQSLQAAAKILLLNPAEDTALLWQAVRQLDTFGSVAEDMHQSDIAVRSFRSALTLVKAIPTETLKEQADLTRDLGIALFRNKAWDEAFATLKDALLLNKLVHGEISVPVGDCYNHLGSSYYDRGDYKEAIQFYQKQYDVLFKINKGQRSKYYSYPLANMAAAYGALGAFSKAADLYEQSAELFDQTNDYHHYLLNSASETYLSAGSYPDALRTQIKCIELKTAFYKTEFHIDLGNAYRQLGNIHLAQGTFSSADSILQHSLYILKNCKGDNSLPIAQTYLSLAISADAQQSIERGLGYCDQAIIHCTNEALFTLDNLRPAFIQKLQDPQLLSDILKVQGDLLMRSAAKNSNINSLKNALQVYLGALDCNTFLYKNMQEDDSKIYLNEQSFALYEKSIEAATSLAAAEPKEPWLDQAFTIVEKSKANLLLESVRQSGAQQFAGVSNAMITKEALLQEKKLQIESAIRQNEPSGKGDKNQAIMALQDSLFAIDEAYQNFTEDLAKESPEYFRLKYDTSSINLSNLKKRLPNDETMVLEYFWGDEYIFGFGISEKNTIYRKIKIDDALQKHLSLVKHFIYSRLQQPGEKESYLSSGYALYQLLVEPFVKEAQVEEIVIIPDGELSRLPFQALLSKPVTNHPAGNYSKLPYLVKDYLISYSFSSSILLEPLPHRKAKITFGGFAPSYSQTDGRIAASRSVVDSSLLNLTDRGYLRPLTFNKQEVENISQLMPGEVFLGKEASERAFKTHASRFKILHLAMHGMANDSIPSLAQLIFSETGDSLEDGRLYAYEVFGLSLNADLAVLSACQTGKGRLMRGEGILSLGRAFRFAGCPSIILSYWDVNDAVASRLMQRFYHHLEETNHYAKALEKAKREFIAKTEDERVAHPHFWATYSMIGGYFEKPTTPRWLWMAMIGGVAVFGLFFVLAKRKNA